MRLVINIPDEQYSLIMQSHRSGIERFVDKECMMFSIKNGVKLSDILYTITHEILYKYDDCDIDFKSGMETSIDIINDYLKQRWNKR